MCNLKGREGKIDKKKKERKKNGKKEDKKWGNGSYSTGYVQELYNNHVRFSFLVQLSEIIHDER